MDGRKRRLSRLAPDLVKTKPDLIVTFTGGATEAAKRATGTIPIVMANRRVSRRAGAHRQLGPSRWHIT
jgi:hypothetical protein